MNKIFLQLSQAGRQDKRELQITKQGYMETEKKFEASNIDQKTYFAMNNTKEAWNWEYELATLEKWSEDVVGELKVTLDEWKNAKYVYFPRYQGVMEKMELSHSSVKGDFRGPGQLSNGCFGDDMGISDMDKETVQDIKELWQIKQNPKQKGLTIQQVDC